MPTRRVWWGVGGCLLVVCVGLERYYGEVDRAQVRWHMVQAAHLTLAHDVEQLRNQVERLSGRVTSIEQTVTPSPPGK